MIRFSRKIRVPVVYSSTLVTQMQVSTYRTWIPVIALALSGCYAPVAQQVVFGVSEPLRVVPNAPASVLLDNDSTVRYARVRLVADSLYAWEYQASRAPKDSVVIAVHRIRAIEQDRLNIPATLGAVIAGLTSAVLVGLVTLLLLLQNDHS